MKKKYFAKYLPAEGEIKKGSVAQGDDLFYRIESIDKGKRLVRSTKGQSLFINKLKLVELFLCARDIKAGDIVYVPVYKTYGKVYDNYRESKTEVEVFGKFYPEVFPKKDLVKPIGKISPEATWVKNGDEFDEDDWKWFGPMDHFDSDPCIVDKVLNKKLNTRFDGGLDGSYLIIIKGPCTHFH